MTTKGGKAAIVGALPTWRGLMKPDISLPLIEIKIPTSLMPLIRKQVTSSVVIGPFRIRETAGK